MRSREPIPEYLAGAKAIMLDLKAADSPVEESEVALQVLVGLPQGYEVAVGIFQFQDDLDLDELLPKLLLAEQRLQEQGDLEAVRVTETAYAAYGAPKHVPRRDLGACFYCNKQGHAQKNCHQRESGEKKGILKNIAF